MPRRKASAEFWWNPWCGKRTCTNWTSFLPSRTLWSFSTEWAFTWWSAVYCRSRRGRLPALFEVLRVRRNRRFADPSARTLVGIAAAYVGAHGFGGRPIHPDSDSPDGYTPKVGIRLTP